MFFHRILTTAHQNLTQAIMNFQNSIQVDILIQVAHLIIHPHLVEMRVAARIEQTHTQLPMKDYIILVPINLLRLIQKNRVCFPKRKI